MNPQNGEVYAMGSSPSFDPSIFTQPVLPQAEYNQLTNPANGDPLLNRAIRSAGPTGSTFKPITATAALMSGVWAPDQTFDDTGQYCFSGECRHNAGHAVDGTLDLQSAIEVSSDDFFYHLGVLTNVSNPVTQPNGAALQEWASKFGIGHRTGIDLPGVLVRHPADARRGARRSTSWKRNATTSPTQRRCFQTIRTTSYPVADEGWRSTRSRTGRSATTRTWPSARATCR